MKLLSVVNGIIEIQIFLDLPFDETNDKLIESDGQTIG